MKYSVLMSLYKKENPEWFCMAVESMMNQTVIPDEIVIVEDGQLPDKLEEKVKFYENNYSKIFKIIRNPVNQGLGIALNCGLKICKNELVARMDTDDISVNNRCEIELRYLEQHPETVLVGSNVYEFSNNIDNIIDKRIVPSSFESIYKFAKRRNPFNHPTVMFRKSKVLEVGGYSKLRYGQDYELFGRMLIKGYRLENIDECLLYFRRDDKTFEKRKNKESIRCYIETVKEFKRQGFSSWKDVMFVITSQTILSVLPSSIISILYKIVRCKDEKN